MQISFTLSFLFFFCYPLWELLLLGEKLNILIGTFIVKICFVLSTSFPAIYTNSPTTTKNKHIHISKSVHFLILDTAEDGISLDPKYLERIQCIV